MLVECQNVFMVFVCVYETLSALIFVQVLVGVSVLVLVFIYLHFGVSMWIVIRRSIRVCMIF